MIKISDKEFNLLTEYLKISYGINLSKKRTLIEGRLNNYLTQKGYLDYKSYMENLFSDGTGAEMSNILNCLTTNYSYFLREWDHFKFYKNVILQEMKEKIKDNDLRIWSAGCSTGEEPYTIAMINNEFFEKKAPVWDTKILATDISIKALNIAKKGVYDSEALEKAPARWKILYFDKAGKNQWEVKKELKDEVIFRRFNLTGGVFPFKKKFNVIFCRNVMIYFDSRAKRKLVDKFYEYTEPGGYLLTGHSESIDRGQTGYSFVMPSVYKKAGC